MKRVAVVGSGNVATHIIKSLETVVGEFCYAGCYARRLSSVVPDADIYIIAVSDDAITEVSRLLPCGALVLHTSGSKPMDSIDGSIARRGVLYPLQMFNRGMAVDMKSVPFFIECNNAADMLTLDSLARMIGGRVTYTDSERRKLIHIAAVFACNFTNHMYAIAQEILDGADLDISIMEPLIKEGLKKVFLTDNIYNIQTGPAIRGDHDTINEHRKMLSTRSENLEHIYNEITNSIIKNGKF